MSVSDLEKNAADRMTPLSLGGTGSRDPESDRQQLDDIEKNAAIPSIAQAEREKNQPKYAAQKKQNRKLLMGIFTSKTARKRSALSALLLVLFGGGGFLTVFFSPSLAIVHMKEVFTESLNDQLRTVDERSAMLLRGKLKDITRGSCGAIKINCKFATMTDRQVAKFKAAGIEIEREPSKILPKRGTITKITYIKPDGQKLEITDAKQLNSALLSADNSSFRASMQRGFNPLVKSFGDKIALNTMRMLKVTKNVVATGDSDKERQQRVNNAVSGVGDAGAKPIVIKTDEDGKEMYFDSEGNELTKEQVDAAEEQSKRISNSVGTSKLLSQAAMGASIVGYMDVSCTVYNSMRFVSALSKVNKKAQAARYSMAMVMTPADSIKAGDAKEGDINYIGNNHMDVRLASNVIDESKLYQEGSASNPPLINDPEAGMNSFDSPGYKIAAYGDAPDLSLRASRFTIAGGSTALLDGVIRSIATVVNSGDPNPQEVSRKCGYIQNPAVRFTGLAIGIIAGIGSFGISTALGVGGSMALALALPYIEAQAAEIIAGNVFEDISGIDTGDAAYVGAAGLMGSVAMNRGLKPLSKEEGLKQLAANKETYQRYAENERFIARSTPFDLTNRFSFLGSVAFSLTPAMQRSKTSASMAMMNIASLIPASFASLLPSAKAMAVNPAYFDKCNDQAYKAVGIACGPFGEERYGLSEEELKMDQFENNTWMAETGNIDPDSETGEPKNNNQPWNYVKFLEQCTYRTVGWGENQNENEGDGSNCIKPENEELNKHFRVYTVDRSVDEMYDGEDLLESTSAAYRSGQTSTAGADGWALPTVDTFTIVGNYTFDHQSIDLADENEAVTIGKPVFAARDGRVVAAGTKTNYGNWVVIEHDIEGRKMSTVYGHLESTLVDINDTIKAGDEIGKVGKTGTTPSARLRFELWSGSPLDGGSRTDPTPIITALLGRSDEVSDV